MRRAGVCCSPTVRRSSQNTHEPPRAPAVVATEPSNITGLATACQATLQRIRWKVRAQRIWITDEGRVLNLRDATPICPQAAQEIYGEQVVGGLISAERLGGSEAGAPLFVFNTANCIRQGQAIRRFGSVVPDWDPMSTGPPARNRARRKQSMSSMLETRMQLQTRELTLAMLQI